MLTGLLPDQPMRTEKQIATISNVGLQFLNYFWSQAFRVVAVIGHAYDVLTAELLCALDELGRDFHFEILVPTVRGPVVSAFEQKSYWNLFFLATRHPVEDVLDESSAGSILTNLLTEDYGMPKREDFAFSEVSKNTETLITIFQEAHRG